MIDKQMCQTLYERLVQQEADVSCCGIANFDGEKIVSYFNPNLEDSFTFTQEIINALPWDAAKYGYVPGETVNIRDLLYVLMLRSANEVAIVL